MSITSLLSAFNLDDKEQTVYLTLLKNGFLTVLQLSYKVDIKRSSLYRILESLEKKGLLEIKLDDKTSYYGPANPKNFENLVIEQEKKAIFLRQNLGILNTSLQLLTTPTNQQTELHFYRGKRGIQTLEWKMVEIEKITTYILGASKWDSVVGQDFAEEIRAERVAKQIKIMEILNPETDQIIPENGQVEWTKNTQFVTNWYEHRVINPKILSIDNEVMINPEAIYFFSLQENEVVGIELKNQAYAQIMSSLFKFAWNKAQGIDKFAGQNFDLS